MNADNNTFDPTPRLKSSPVPVLFIPFKNDENMCNYCGDKYSVTLKFKQKYCKNCLFLYIKDTKGNDTYLDTYIITNNAQCIKHEVNRNNFNTMNIQEWCEYCSEVSYFRQVIPNTLSFNNSYLSLYCTHKKIDCELCDKQWSSYLSKHGQDCYQIFSGWVESTLIRASISILYLPWWDNCNKCSFCELDLKYILHQESECYYQKWCSKCYVIYTGCRYCLTTNIIFGITDQSQCMKCKRILFITIDITNMFSGNYIIDELLASTIFDNNQQYLIADYMNNNTNINPLKVYKFIIKHLRKFRLVIKWIPYSQIENLRKIAEGGFSIIYKAIWVDGSLDRDVAIKRLHNSQNISKYFLDELKSFCQLNNKGCGLIMCHGITQDPITKEYMLIMDYAEGGDLHNYLQKNFINITWIDKINILNDISSGLHDEIYGSAIDWKYMCSYFYDMPLLFEIIEEFQQAEETRLELTQLKKLGPEFKYITKEYEFDINNIQSLSSNNINSAEQCSFNSQYQPQSKPILTITTNSSKKRDIEELKIETQNDRKRGKTSACCHTTDLNL
ncbi:unnamed protein product [Rhizophagus irregularis]|nr:unnamed protein product [Rhizophagus irregularis]